MNYPDKQTFFDILDVVDQVGVGYVEIGVPVSNPFLDGEVVRRSQEQVMDAISHDEVVDTLTAMRKKYRFRIILMTYYEGVSRYALDKLDHALYDALLCVDKRLDEQNYTGLVHTFTSGMAPVEVKQLVAGSSEFIYVISGSGKTGEFTSLPTEYIETVAQIKPLTDLPVLVGFGVKDRADIETVLQNGADGAVIGSEFLKRVASGGVGGVREYLGELID